MSDTTLGAGWIGGPIGDVANDSDGADAYASSNLDGVDWFSTSKQIASGLGRGLAYTGTVDDFGNTITTPEPLISANEANEKYAVTPPSGFKPLKFDNPVPESVAKSMYEAKLDEVARNDAAQRAPAGFGNSVIRGGLNLFAGLLDPVNVAAAFVPGLGEASVARTLGLEGIESLGARTVVRGIAGASQGIAGQIPLSALRYGLSQEDQSDYSALDAMSDIAMGGLIGGGLHTMLGGVGDFMGERFHASPQARIVDDDPATRDAALRTSVAAVAEDRPVDVSSLIDLGGAQAEQTRLLGSLRDEAAGLRYDIQQVPGVAPDPVTAERLSAIEDELTDPSGTLPQNRRSDLMQEHAMLTEGSAPTDQDTLEVARSASQREGLQAALDRTNARIADLQDTIRTSDAARRAQGAPDPDAKATSDMADTTADATLPRAAPPDVDPDEMQTLQASVQAMRDRGALDPETAAQFDAMTEQAKTDEGTANALREAALCMMGSV